VAVTLGIAHGVGEETKGLDGDVGDFHGWVPGLFTKGD
jgi:hypothetical protein